MRGGTKYHHTKPGIDTVGLDEVRRASKKFEEILKMCDVDLEVWEIVELIVDGVGGLLVISRGLTRIRGDR